MALRIAYKNSKNISGEREKPSEEFYAMVKEKIDAIGARFVENLKNKENRQRQLAARK